MKVLVVHNYYRQRGGEDAVVESEISMLKNHGVDVRFFSRSNDSIKENNPLVAARNSLWNNEVGRDLRLVLDEYKPDVVHVHNTFPLMSAAVYWIIARTGVPIVQTIHNFRLHCPQAMYLRNGNVCEDCKGKFPWKGVVNRCYRDSYSHTLAVAGALGFHRMIGTYSTKINKYIALNKFCSDKLIEGGVPSDLIVVKPNFIPDVKIESSDIEGRSGGLYVGRLSKEKGIDVLCRAKAICSIDIKVVGDGDDNLKSSVRSAFGNAYLGFCSLDSILKLMRKSSYLVVPSIWYECFPRTVVEAFASGLPVIASRIGALAEIVRDGENGLLFNPGDENDLISKIRWANDHPDEMSRMSLNARKDYVDKYSESINYENLMGIYKSLTN